MRTSKIGALQFVVVKPVFAILSVILLSSGHYYDEGYQITLLTVYNLSYTVALYVLLLFYFATHALLDEHKPVMKFASVKMVVFMTCKSHVLYCRK